MAADGSATTSRSLSSNASGSTLADYTASFATDPRIAFNKVTGKWEFEDDDGNEMEWDMAKNTWVPVVRTWLSSLPSIMHRPLSDIHSVDRRGISEAATGSVQSRRCR